MFKPTSAPNCFGKGGKLSSDKGVLCPILDARPSFRKPKGIDSPNEQLEAKGLKIGG